MKPKRTNQWPTITDAEGRSLMGRAGDLHARLILNDLCMPVYEAGAMQAASSLVHAEQYLADRLVYQLWPWPKGMIRDSEESVSDSKGATTNGGAQ